MIIIRPYIHCDGIPSFRDSDLLKLYAMTQEDGTDKIVFMDGRISSGWDFIDYVKSPGVLLFVALEYDTPAGFGYVDRIENNFGRAHFCIFSKYWGPKAFDVGQRLVKESLRFSGLDMYLGFIPSINERAIKFCCKSGAEIVGTIPFGSVDASGNKYPTTILSYTRSS